MIGRIVCTVRAAFRKLQSARGLSARAAFLPPQGVRLLLSSTAMIAAAGTEFFADPPLQFEASQFPARSSSSSVSFPTSAVDGPLAANDDGEVALFLFPETRTVSSSATTVRVVLRAVARNPASRARNAPLSLPLVLDVSGSMSGAPLALVKEAAELLVQDAELGASDHIGIVPFHTSARIALPLTAMTAEGKQAALKVIQALSTEGSTDLYGACLLGCSLLQNAAREGRPLARAGAGVLLLTDGYNTESTSLKGLLESLDGAGDGERVPVFAVGVGTCHNADELYALAAATGGSYIYLPDSERVAEVLAAVAATLQSALVRDVSVRLQALSPLGESSDAEEFSVPISSVLSRSFGGGGGAGDAGVITAVECPFPVALGSCGGQQALVSFGAMRAGESREALITLQLPPAPSGSAKTVRVLSAGGTHGGWSSGDGGGDESGSYALLPALLSLTREHSALQRTAEDAEDGRRLPALPPEDDFVAGFVRVTTSTALQRVHGLLALQPPPPLPRKSDAPAVADASPAAAAEALESAALRLVRYGAALVGSGGKGQGSSGEGSSQLLTPAVHDLRACAAGVRTAGGAGVGSRPALLSAVSGMRQQQPVATVQLGSASASSSASPLLQAVPERVRRRSQAVARLATDTRGSSIGGGGRGNRGVTTLPTRTKTVTTTASTSASSSSSWWWWSSKDTTDIMDAVGKALDNAYKTDSTPSASPALPPVVTAKPAAETTVPALRASSSAASLAVPLSLPSSSSGPSLTTLPLLPASASGGGVSTTTIIPTVVSAPALSPVLALPSSSSVANPPSKPSPSSVLGRRESSGTLPAALSAQGRREATSAATPSSSGSALKRAGTPQSKTAFGTTKAATSQRAFGSGSSRVASSSSSSGSGHSSRKSKLVSNSSSSSSNGGDATSALAGAAIVLLIAGGIALWRNYRERREKAKAKEAAAAAAAKEQADAFGDANERDGGGRSESEAAQTEA